MNLNDAKNRIQNYLKSEKSYPLIVDLQAKKDLADLVDFFKVGNNKFPPIESLCGQDAVLKLEELYDYVLKNSGNTFITGLTGFLKLFGEQETQKALKALVTTGISGHVVILTYQCKNYLKFSDPRIAETGRLVFVEGTPDTVTDLYLIAPELADAFPGAYQGVERIGYIIENSTYETTYIATNAKKDSFPNSIYYVRQLNNGYDYLCDKDPRTSIVPQSFGDAEQWNNVLALMGREGNWSTVIDAEFGSENKLSAALASYPKFGKQKRWLYFIALSICGVRDNAYLQMAVNNAANAEELIKSVFRAILSVDKDDVSFPSLYKQRKEIMTTLKSYLSEIVDYCKVLSIKGENAIYYLTDVNQIEKERIITWLDCYGQNYEQNALISILKTVYPDLASYLSTFRFKNPLLDQYFDLYKYQKVVNHILPSFEAIVDEQSTKMDFVTALKSRPSVVDKLDAKNSKGFFVDALGVEYLGFIQEKCNEYGLSTNITCARCKLPSLTSFNKEFVTTLNEKGCSVSDIKELDEIKHHGEDNFEYEKQKTPLYLIRELEIIDELLRKIQAGVFGGQYEKAIIISDHGASRLAVLHETENIWSMATTGEHSGRCCQVSEIDSKPDFAVEESGYWVLANHDRFKGSRRANVEVHGGASLEEVAIPIIEISRKQAHVEAFIIDDSKLITLGAKEHAVIRIYVGINSSSIAIKLNGQYYDAYLTTDPYVYSVDIPDCSKKGKYTFDIVNGSDMLATGQQFEIEKKGMTEINLFD